MYQTGKEWCHLSIGDQWNAVGFEGLIIGIRWNAIGRNGFYLEIDHKYEQIMRGGMQSILPSDTLGK